jgi:hypothetical protein
MEAVGGSRAIVVLVDGDVEVVIAALGRATPDLSMVDALARLQLAVRRAGCSIRLRRPCPELVRLLDLVGVAGLLLEPGWQPEGDEQLRVEEVVEPGDPAA